MRRRRSVDPLGPQQAWPVRTITLIADRADTARICAGWTEAGWEVVTVDQGDPSLTGHPTHVVRVAVPPPGGSARELGIDPEDAAPGEVRWDPRALRGGAGEHDEQRDRARGR